MSGKFDNPSPLRSCPHFPRCGGCQCLDKSYTEQLRMKTELLRALFSFAPLRQIPDVLPSPATDYYRCKVQLPFGSKRQGKRSIITLGCYARDSHAVVDQYVCRVQDQELSKVAWAVRDWANDAALPAYDEQRHTGFLRHILLRKGSGTGEILVGLVTNGNRPVGSRHLAQTLLEALQPALAGSNANVVGIVQNVNTRQTNVVLGEREFVWWGRPFLFEKLGNYRFALGLSTFFQVNPSQTPRLYDEVLRWIEQGPAVLDCYCGVGSIALWVSKKSRIVTGVEESGAAVAAARKAALVNKVRNVRFVSGDAEALLPQMLDGGQYDVAIFDPPRKGLDASMIGALLTASLKRIIYVSCSPETLARDVKALQPKWNMISLQGVDMFPHTTHVEAVAVLDKKL